MYVRMCWWFVFKLIQGVVFIVFAFHHFEYPLWEYIYAIICSSLLPPPTTTSTSKSSPTTTMCTVPRAFFIWRFQPQKNPTILSCPNPLRKWRRPCFWVAQATPKPSKRTLNLASRQSCLTGSFLGSRDPGIRRKGGIVGLYTRYLT